MNYNIFLCKKCAGICAAREGTSTFKCLYCNTKNCVDRSLRIATGIESKDVPEVIGQLKKVQAQKVRQLD